jgi:2,3-bisphosphoglycerate-independent phosphoglycerate mutase
MSNKVRPVVLAILDGWGVAPDGDGNAITRAKLPCFSRLVKEYPVMTLSASGPEVGLMLGEMGNSEVGHLNIGAGRVYYQSLPRINKTISDKTFFENKAFLEALAQVKKKKSSLHLIGLLSPGNVHASMEHCFALLEFAKKEKLKSVFVHVILDGRDATFNSGIDSIKKLQAKMKELKTGAIATISGRFYAMDRDNRWDRTEKAYRAMVDGVADAYFENAEDAVNESYKKKVYDEEFVPIVIGKNGAPLAKIQEQDSVIFYNFRPDRARQLTKAFVLPGFDKFKCNYLKGLMFVTMTEYEKELPVVVAFPPVIVHNCLAEVISKEGLKQFHIAETEKYAHITFFLNGLTEDPFNGEDRKIIPSPKVSSYDKQPEMSAPAIAKDVVKAIESEKYDAIMLNFANADMVGHTGNMSATIKSCEAIDKSLEIVIDHALAKDGVVIITADHGNGEELTNLQTGEMDKEHSNNPVPLIIISNKLKGQAGPAGDPPEGDLSLMHPVGMLADVAPTVLKIMGIKQPKEMTGRALI